MAGHGKMMTVIKTPSPVKQTGVALVMALVMLIALTLIGVSSMNSSTTEMKVSSNMKQRNIAFQGAQARLAFAGAQDAVNPVNFLIPIPDLTDPDTWPVQSCNFEDGCANGEGWTATADISYAGCSKGTGNSLEAGKGFSSRTFEIRAAGYTESGSSRSVQVSALLYPVKGCGDETL